MTDELHVLALEARNFLGLHAVELHLGPDGLIASGANGAGKSSALSILEAAFGGKNAEPAVPIHSGTFAAEVAVVAGHDGKPAFRVEKTWEQGKATKLTVFKIDENGQLDKLTSPQKILDGLYDAITFDVGTFIAPPGATTPEAKAKKQTETLLRACPLDIDLDALAAERKKHYNNRTYAKRDLDTRSAELRLLTKQPVPERVNLDELRAKVRGIYDVRAKQQSAVTAVAAIDAEIATLRARFEKLAEERKARVAEAQVATDDPHALEDAISAGEKQNEAAVRIAAANEKYDLLLTKVGASKATADDCTTKIEDCDARRLAALQRAAFPYPGLGIDEALGVTLAENGTVLPYAQLNLAKKAEIAVAVGAKLAEKYRLRALRIDGNLFDRPTLAAVLKECKARGVQPFVERIASDVPGSVVFEAGAVSGVVAGAKPAEAKVTA